MRLFSNRGRLWLISLVLVACANQPTSHGDRIILGVARGLLNWPNRYIINADGTGQVAIGLPNGLGDQAEWSPDGQWIVFSTLYSSGRPEDSAIYLMRSDGGQRVQLVSRSFHPIWSHDGKQIAYYNYSEGSIYTLDMSCFLINEECHPIPQLIVQGRDPAWSPDGKYIVYGSEIPPGKVSMINSDGTGSPLDLTQDLSQCFEPEWSPDGAEIVLRCRDGIYVIRANGSDALNIEQGSGSIKPRWAPSGDRIAFISMKDGLGKIIGLDDTSRSSALFVMNADGTNITRVSQRDDESIQWFAWLPTFIAKP